MEMCEHLEEGTNSRHYKHIASRKFKRAESMYSSRWRERIIAQRSSKTGPRSTLVCTTMKYDKSQEIYRLVIDRSKIF